MDEVTIKKIMRNMEAFYASESNSNYIKAEPVARNLMDDGMSEKEAWEIAYQQVDDVVWNYY